MEEGLLPRPSSEERRWAGVFGGFEGMKEEAGRLGRLAAPMVAVTVAQYLVQVVSMMLVGQLGELALSGAAIATSLCNVTGFSLFLGMASGLDTLCGQAFGAQQYQKLGSHTYKAILTLLLVCIPISFLWASMGKFLSLIGQDPLISREAGKYAAWMIPSLFAFATSQPLARFLQAQSLTFPLLLGSFATLCLHVPLCWVLVFKSGLGNAGASLAIGISYWVNVLILGLYVYYSSSCKATRAPVTREAFQNVNEFLRLAIPSAVMICLEWWSYELLILMSGLLPNPQLETSVLSICLTTISTLYAIPYGIGAAASTRVSNELGAGNPRGAQTSVCVSMLVAVTEAAITSLTLFAMRNFWGRVYSYVDEVVTYVTKLAPLVCISIVVDSLQGVLSGILLSTMVNYIFSSSLF
uniref:MATE efflux family protein 9 n=2 Tax=Anthurium amnicola TaxID=1678845 RepID=A0A1D1Y895_9ARAE